MAEQLSGTLFNREVGDIGRMSCGCIIRVVGFEEHDKAILQVLSECGKAARCPGGSPKTTCITALLYAIKGYKTAPKTLDAPLVLQCEYDGLMHLLEDSFAA